MKCCTVCRVSKPLTEFGKHGNGLRPDCKKCNAARVAAWRESLTPERAEDFRKRNNESARRRYQEKHPPKPEKVTGLRFRDPPRQLTAEQRERARIRSRERYYANHEAELEKKRQRLAANPEARAKAARLAREWREKNPERFAVTRQRWRDENWDKVLDCNARRRAKERTTSVERFSRAEIYERDGRRCHICGEHIPRRQFVIDHLVPLSKGGPHTRDNVAAAHARCNLRRADGRLPAQLLLVG